MAIVFDSIGTSKAGTASHTINSNANAIILACFAGAINFSSINASPKFAGQNMTKIISGTNIDHFMVYEMWYLLNPPVGLGTVAGTWSVAQDDMALISLAYTGVSQGAGAIAGSALSIGTVTTSGSVTRSVGLNNWWVGGAFIDQLPGTTTTGNQRGTLSTTLGGFEAMAADSTGGTLRWTFPGSDNVLIGAELTALPDGGNFQPSSSLQLLFKHH